MTGDSEKGTDKKMGNSVDSESPNGNSDKSLESEDPRFQELSQISKNSILLKILKLKNPLIIKNQRLKLLINPKTP